MSTFLIRSATSQSSSYPIVLTRLGGPWSRPNPHGSAGDCARDFMISCQTCWPLDQWDHYSIKFVIYFKCEICHAYMNDNAVIIYLINSYAEPTCKLASLPTCGKSCFYRLPGISGQAYKVRFKFCRIFIKLKIKSGRSVSVSNILSKSLNGAHSLSTILLSKSNTNRKTRKPIQFYFIDNPFW